MRILKLTGFLLVALLTITVIGGNAADYKEIRSKGSIMIGPDSISESAKDERQDVMEVKRVSLKLNDYRFVPDKIAIEPGTTVEWINTGKKVHTVTDEHASWDSGNLKPGEKFSHRFDEKGTFKYYCVPHQEIGMTGTIVVK